MMDVVELIDLRWFGCPAEAPNRRRPRGKKQLGLSRPGEDVAVSSSGSLSSGSSKGVGDGSNGSRAGSPSPAAPPSRPLQARPDQIEAQQRDVPARTKQHRPAPIAQLVVDAPPSPLADAYDLPGLGTWASRQRIFGKAVSPDALPKRTTSTPDDATAAATAASSSLVAHPLPPTTEDEQDTSAGSPSPVAASSPDDVSEEQLKNTPKPLESGDDSMIHEAWRWRFARKWQQEQLRQNAPPEPEASGDFDEDDWSSAMEYMAAAAGGLNLQFGRTTSLDRSNSLSLDQGLSTATSFMLANSLSREMLFSAETPGPLATETSRETPMATRRIIRAAHRARELMAAQEKIEKEVNERWEATANGQEQAWPAQRIPAVTIDSWGSFQFILCRLTDRGSGRQKLLVRGSNRYTEGQAQRALTDEVTAAATTLRLPTPTIDILGTGTMSWSAQRDRSLNITGTTVHGAASSQVITKEDVGRVAGALARTGMSSLHSVVVVNPHTASAMT